MFNHIIHDVYSVQSKSNIKTLIWIILYASIKVE